LAPDTGLSRGGRPGDEPYYLQTRKRLEHAYPRAEDNRGGSGSRKGAGSWERAKRPITSAIDRDGIFLDNGCANGLLMKSLVERCGQSGRRIEPYSLDLLPSLAALACCRLPRWSDRIIAGNVVNWAPPFRFDFVRKARVRPARPPPGDGREAARRVPRSRRASHPLLLRQFYAGGRFGREDTPGLDLPRPWRVGGHRRRGHRHHPRRLDRRAATP
jgi:hypothetical protein